MPDKQKCLPTIDRLMENESLISRRYATVARLMRADLEPLKPDSLDEIARLMDEMRRRLNLRRAGTRVRKQGDEIVAKLDKLIEQIEEQQQQAAAGAASLQSGSPAQDSTPMGGKGPGNVDPKQLGTQSGWGNLPPQERQEALQQIGKDLPAHYREVIEEYFRKLAREGEWTPIITTRIIDDKDLTLQWLLDLRIAAAVGVGTDGGGVGAVERSRARER